MTSRKRQPCSTIPRIGSIPIRCHCAALTGYSEFNFSREGVMNLLEKRLRMLGILGIGGIFDWNALFDVFPGDICKVSVRDEYW